MVAGTLTTTVDMLKFSKRISNLLYFQHLFFLNIVSEMNSGFTDNLDFD